MAHIYVIRPIEHIKIQMVLDRKQDRQLLRGLAERIFKDYDVLDGFGAEVSVELKNKPDWRAVRLNLAKGKLKITYLGLWRCLDNKAMESFTYDLVESPVEEIIEDIKLVVDKELHPNREKFPPTTATGESHDRGAGIRYTKIGGPGTGD